MHYATFCLSLGLLLALIPSCDAASKEKRVQIWQYKNEEPLPEPSLNPTVHSVRWREGDLEVIFTQAAPCGAWMPVNPAWRVEEFSVVLNFAWHPQSPNTPEPTALCKKFVRAWVFRVPHGNYKVSFAESVPRFRQQDGQVSSVPSHR